MSASTATTHRHAYGPVVVTDELRTASLATSDLVAVAIHADGDQEVLPVDQIGVVSGDDMHVWHIVAVSYGYVYDDGTWCEHDRTVRGYWTVTDAHGADSHYATRLEHR